MALPSIATPEFFTKIPSTGQEIKYRPFLVKEEKILLMALEGGDTKEITNAVLNILESCIVGDVDVRKLATFDVEYLFLQLRGKSVGEVIELKVGHTSGECQHKTDVQINLDNIKVQGEVSDGKIMLNDDIGVKVRYPNISDAMSQTGTETEGMFGVIANCIEYVYDQSEVYNDFTHEEMVAWVTGLSQSQFALITNMLSEMPKLAHTVEWTCTKCGETDSIKLEGLQSFFT